MFDFCGTYCKLKFLYQLTVKHSSHRTEINPSPSMLLTDHSKCTSYCRIIFTKKKDIFSFEKLNISNPQKHQENTKMNPHIPPLHIYFQYSAILKVNIVESFLYHIPILFPSPEILEFGVYFLCMLLHYYYKFKYLKTSHYFQVLDVIIPHVFYIDVVIVFIIIFCNLFLFITKHIVFT